MKATTKLLTAAVLAAALAGCGENEEAAGGGGDATASTTTTTGDATSTTDGDGDGDGDATTSSAVPSFTGEGGEEFCAMNEEFDLDNAFANAQSPEDLEASFEQVVTALDEMAQAAPAEISDDVAAVSEAWEGLREPLEEAGWDLLQVDPAVFNSPDLAQLEDSSARLDAYLSDVCGIEPAESEG